jgi:hypothetical protein
VGIHLIYRDRHARAHTEVKLFSAYGTAWETAWESRSPPELIYKPLDSLITDQGAFFNLSLSGRGAGRGMKMRDGFIFLTYNMEMICFISQKGFSYIFIHFFETFFKNICINYSERHK